MKKNVNSCQGYISWPFPVKFPPGACQKTALMISQHWFSWWLGVVRQWTITWANADQDKCRHMSSLCHNVCNCSPCTSKSITTTATYLSICVCMPVVLRTYVVKIWFCITDFDILIRFWSTLICRFPCTLKNIHSRVENECSPWANGGPRATPPPPPPNVSETTSCRIMIWGI